MALTQTAGAVVAHPLRIAALSILAERPASPKELAAELGSPVGNISYHVRELERLGMIELVDEKKRRGAIEHFYRAVQYPMLDVPEWEKLSPAKREVMSVWIVQLMLADAVKALGARHLRRARQPPPQPHRHAGRRARLGGTGRDPGEDPASGAWRVRERNAKRLAKARRRGRDQRRRLDELLRAADEPPPRPPGSSRRARKATISGVWPSALAMPAGTIIVSPLTETPVLTPAGQRRRPRLRRRSWRRGA